MHKKKKTGFWWYKEIAEEWKIFASPVAPSKNECQIVEKFIIRHKKLGKPLEILILGATPQLRDIAHHQRAKVTCADVSIDMLFSQAQVMKYKKQAEREIWVVANWLKLPLAENYYDFALGDFVIGQIPVKLQPLFLAKIRKLLKPGGYFIVRDHLPFSIAEKPAKEILNEFLVNPKFDEKYLWGLGFDLVQNSYRERDGNTSTKRMHLQLKKAWQREKDEKNKKLLAKLMKILTKMLPPGKKWWHQPVAKRKKMLNKFFKIEAIKHGSDHLRTQFCPIYFLRKK